MCWQFLQGDAVTGIQYLFSSRQPFSLGPVINVEWRLIFLKMCQSSDFNGNKVVSAGSVDAPMGTPCFSSSPGCPSQTSGSWCVWLHRQGCVPKPKFHPSPGPMEGEFPQLGLLCALYPSAPLRDNPRAEEHKCHRFQNSLACPSCLASREKNGGGGEADFPRGSPDSAASVCIYMTSCCCKPTLEAARPVGIPEYGFWCWVSDAWHHSREAQAAISWAAPSIWHRHIHSWTEVLGFGCSGKWLEVLDVVLVSLQSHQAPPLFPHCWWWQERRTSCSAWPERMCCLLLAATAIPKIWILIWWESSGAELYCPVPTCELLCWCSALWRVPNPLFCIEGCVVGRDIFLNSSLLRRESSQQWCSKAF